MIIDRVTMTEWVIEALHELGSKGSILDVCIRVWKNHGKEIIQYEEVFFKWQYEVRWSGDILRKERILKSSDESQRGVWELHDKYKKSKIYDKHDEINAIPEGLDAIVTKEILTEWILESLHNLGGSACILDICKEIWREHKELKDDSLYLFYTWQYDLRWAADVLRTEGLLKPAKESIRGIWELSKQELSKLIK